MDDGKISLFTISCSPSSYIQMLIPESVSLPKSTTDNTQAALLNNTARPQGTGASFVSKQYGASSFNNTLFWLMGSDDQWCHLNEIKIPVSTAPFRTKIW
jgi:hypothetical protein